MKPDKLVDLSVGEIVALAFAAPDHGHRPILPWSEGGAVPNVFLRSPAFFKKACDPEPLMVEDGVTVRSDGLCNHIDILWDDSDRAGSMERYRRWRGILPPHVDDDIEHPPLSRRETLEEMVANLHKVPKAQQDVSSLQIYGRFGDELALWGIVRSLAAVLDNPATRKKTRSAIEWAILIGVDYGATAQRLMMREASKGIRAYYSQKETGRKGGKKGANIGKFESIEERNQAIVEYWLQVLAETGGSRPSKTNIATKVKECLLNSHNVGLSVPRIIEIHRKNSDTT